MTRFRVTLKHCLYDPDYRAGERTWMCPVVEVEVDVEEVFAAPPDRPFILRPAPPVQPAPPRGQAPDES